MVSLCFASSGTPVSCMKSKGIDSVAILMAIDLIKACQVGLCMGVNQAVESYSRWDNLEYFYLHPL